MSMRSGKYHRTDVRGFSIETRMRLSEKIWAIFTMFLMMLLEAVKTSHSMPGMPSGCHLLLIFHGLLENDIIS